MEYGCQVWNPYLIKDIQALESIQRRATRLICGPGKSYEKRLSNLNWMTLELKRKCLCLVQLYKIVFGFCDIDCNMSLDIVGRSTTRSNHDLKLRPKIVHTNYFKYSFFNRYISDWNSLPRDVVHSPSLQLFKTNLLKFLRSVN